MRSRLQGLRVEASGETFWRWLGSSAGALPLSLWEAAAAQKLPTEVLAAADADRENHCRQAFSMVSINLSTSSCPHMHRNLVPPTLHNICACFAVSGASHLVAVRGRARLHHGYIMLKLSL